MAATEGAPPGQASSLLSQPPLFAAAAVLLLLLALAWLATRRGARGASGRAAAGGGGAKQRDTVVLVGPSGAGKTVLLHQVRRRRARAARTHTRAHTRAACATTTTRAHARGGGRRRVRVRARERTHARCVSPLLPGAPPWPTCSVVRAHTPLPARRAAYARQRARHGHVHQAGQPARQARPDSGAAGHAQRDAGGPAWAPSAQDVRARARAALPLSRRRVVWWP